MSRREHVLSAKRIMRAYIKSPESFNARRSLGEPKLVIIGSRAEGGSYVYVRSSPLGSWSLSGYRHGERVLDTEPCWSVPLFSVAARFWWAARKHIPFPKNERQELEADILGSQTQPKEEM